MTDYLTYDVNAADWLTFGDDLRTPDAPWLLYGEEVIIVGGYLEVVASMAIAAGCSDYIVTASGIVGSLSLASRIAELFSIAAGAAAFDSVAAGVSTFEQVAPAAQ